VTAPLESAEQTVTDARQAPAFWRPVAQGLINGRAMDAALDAVIAAAEARYEARLREAANSPHVDDRARKAGHFLADVVADWPAGSRITFGPAEGIDTEESRP